MSGHPRRDEVRGPKWQVGPGTGAQAGAPTLRASRTEAGWGPSVRGVAGETPRPGCAAPETAGASGAQGSVVAPDY